MRSLVDELPERLQHHLFHTRETALELASTHKVEPQKVEVAALGHDLLRVVSGEILLQKARDAHIPVHPIEEQIPILLHGPMAAHTLKSICGVDDTEILEAIHWHSTSHPHMGKVGLVVFLADKLDPHKIAANPQLKKLSTIAQFSLEQAVYNYLKMEITFLLEQGRLIHPASLDTLNYLLPNI